jgi:uncharacterized membrane protein YgaE (UPF0421/DUF939 family)
MKFSIGYRTLKTSVGAMLSIMIAQFLGFDNFVSAGILTILCIQATKKKSLRASWERLLSCVVGMLFSIVFFEFIGYHPIVIGMLLLLYIPTVVMLKASDGVVSSTVIILHFYLAKNVTLHFILNEFAIILIGIGVALLINMYMPSVDHKLLEYKREIEENLKKIFTEIVYYLRSNDLKWDGREIHETAKLLHEAKALSFRELENHFLRTEDLYYTYFKMREKQFEIIERVLPIITSISNTVEQGKMIADFIEDLAEHIHGGNTALIYLEKLYRLRIEFQNMDLPKTREEFEARAALLHFVQEMEQYLQLKRSFRGVIKDNVHENKGSVGT